MDACRFHGHFHYEWRDRHGVLIRAGVFRNGITTEGLTLGLNVLFGATAKPTWYAGLISSASFSSLSSSDTAASHTNWTEYTAYSESVRQTLSFGAAGSAQIATSAGAVFTGNATGTVKGGFLITNSTKGGSTGSLWCTGLLDSEVSLQSGQTFTFYPYTLTAAGT